jgi:iron(III) transport system substrate-binding protein
MNRQSLALLALSGLAALTFSGCTQKKELWIYTSLYKELIAEMTPALERAVPGVRIQWYPAGSENVASKVNAELAAGKTRADLVLTSDPFWYLELKQAGRLLPYESPAAKAVESRFRDPEHAFVNVRLPVMVIAYHRDAIPEAEAPKTWKELADPKWKGKLSMGSPLESGTMFTAVALLSRLYGWEYFQTLRAHDLVAAGGNNSVITRIETQERPLGIVLIENVLKAQDRGSPVQAIYPADGAIPVPSPIAIFKDTDDAEAAKKVYDWFFTEEAQRLVVKGGMYAALPSFESPARARAWNELSGSLMPWSPQTLSEIFSQRDAIKQKFSDVVFH